MFPSVAGFEFRYQIRQPVFWVVAILFFLLTFGSIASADVHIGGDSSNVHKNAPFVIAQTTLFMSIFFMFVTTAFVANVVVRDDETGFGPILRTTRLRKLDYVLGRFTGAFAAAALAFLVVPAAIWIGSVMPWIDSETLGPNRFGDYLFAYLVLALPTLFITAAVFFLVACLTRSMVGAYIAVVAFLVIFTVATAVLGEKPELRHLLALIDPFGLFAYGEASRYWTAADRNTLTPPLVGDLLWNRVIWIAAGLALLGAAHSLFRFSSRGAKLNTAQKLASLAPAEAMEADPGAPLPRPVFNAATARAQFWARTRLDMAQVFKSPVFFVLVALGLFNATASLLFVGELYGTDIRLDTRIAIEGLRGSFTIIPVIIAIFYGGELVWRDRDKRLHEIIDATAVPNWAFVVPKTLAITLVLIATFAISVVAAILVQAIKGVTDFELDHYLVWYVLPESIFAVLIAVLAVFLQAISPHKFIGWAAMLVVFLIAPVFLRAFGFEDRLYLYARVPDVPMSDMNGMGRFWEAAAWFQAYWAALAVVLLVLAHVLWRRGAETRLRPRLARVPLRLEGAAGAILGAALVAFVGLGVFIFLNTHVWNAYRTQLSDDQRLADYEKTLLKFETLPQPTVTDVTLAVDLHPHAPSASAHGTYRLENRTGAPIRDLHLRYDLDTRIVGASVTGGRLLKTYPEFHYQIFRFDQPLAPGASALLTFDTWKGQHGFTNNGYGVRIVDNGTFLSNFELAPAVGMGRDTLLTDRSKRRRYHLPAELRIAKLDIDPSARAKNYIGAAWVNADITVTTDADQTPIAPGYKLSDITANGRRTARYKTDAPVLNVFSIQSARYAEKHETYKGVDIGVYYYPGHPWNVDRMIAAAKVGLDSYQARYSPFQFNQYRSIEFPAYARFAQSFANTVPWSEDLGFLTDLRDKSKIDYVTYVGDHELAHQWWAHQVIGADMQGATLLSETQAQYSALMVMEKLYGPDKIRRFLKFELDTYLRSRGGEALEELPLEKVEPNQGYIHYRKGALVMYLLKDQIGEANVDAALRDVLHRYAFQGAPYPTSLDLVSALRAHAPLDKQTLITDLFERITLYDLKATAATAKKRPDGRWDVHLTVQASKLYAEGRGKERTTPLYDESFDLGLFAAKPGEGPFGSKDVILFERRPLHSGQQSFDFVVSKKPAWAGVDPYNKRIDRNSDDNLIAVE